MKTYAGIINSANINQHVQLSLLPEVEHVQETTHQVPCGAFSIFEPPEPVTEFERAVYLVINYHSNWDSGKSHALSYREIAKKMGLKHHSQVVVAVKSLISKGWLKVAGKRKSDGANFYKVTHYNCDEADMPKDKHNRFQKCAIQCGAGSAIQMLFDGTISWRVMVHSFVQKIYSDWVDGICKMTVRKAMELMRFTAKTISENVKTMQSVGLAKLLSKKNRASEFQLLPKPYPKRRKRAEPIYPTTMKLKRGYYYSLNELWRFHRETLQVQMRELNGKWRDSDMEELFGINPKIYRDFNDSMDRLAEFYANRGQATSFN